MARGSRACLHERGGRAGVRTRPEWGPETRPERGPGQSGDRAGVGTRPERGSGRSGDRAAVGTDESSFALPSGCGVSASRCRAGGREGGRLASRGFPSSFPNAQRRGHQPQRPVHAQALAGTAAGDGHRRSLLPVPSLEPAVRKTRACRVVLQKTERSVTRRSGQGRKLPFPPFESLKPP